MDYMRFVYGLNMYDLFFIPTIRFETHCEMRYLTVEWLNLYMGIQWEVKEFNKGV